MPTRGLLQGDPLSPYLFILYADDLSYFSQEAVSSSMLQGCKISKRGPSLFHLFFGNDSLIFFNPIVAQSSFKKYSYHL